MYAKIINEETKEVSVGVGTNAEFYKSIGMTEMEVEQAYNGSWYVKGYAPEKPIPTNDEQAEKRKQAYIAEVDPITAHINRLKDEEQTEEIVAEIESLKAERSAKIQEIKERFPYYEQESEERFADDSNTIEDTEE